LTEAKEPIAYTKKVLPILYLHGASSLYTSRLCDLSRLNEADLANQNWYRAADLYVQKKAPMFSELSSEDIKPLGFYGP